MDEFYKSHLETWLEKTVDQIERDKVRSDILQIIEEYPELLEAGRSWPELQALTERKL